MDFTECLHCIYTNLPGGILSQDCQADEYDWKRYGVIARAGFQQ